MKGLYRSAYAYNDYYEPTGDYRAPLKGEHFLSGAVVEAHIALDNMTTPYHIAKLAKPRPISVCSHCRKDWIADHKCQRAK